MGNGPWSCGRQAVNAQSSPTEGYHFETNSSSLANMKGLILPKRPYDAQATGEVGLPSLAES